MDETEGRYRRWCFVWNNYTEEDMKLMEYMRDNMAESHLRRLIVGLEHAPTTGTPHFQGYFGFTKAYSLGMLKKRFGNQPSFQAARGKDEHSENYCSKENLWINEGENIQGKRNDIVAVRDAVRDGMGIRTMINNELIGSLQQLRLAEKLLVYVEPKRKWVPEVWVLWGAPGAGKTRRAYEILGEDVYVKRGSTGKWWDGYDGEEDVLLDEFRGSQMPLTDLLGVLDRYEYRTEFKGGTRQLLARRIVITSPFHPEKWYEHAKGEPLGQLKRRITHIEHVVAEADVHVHVQKSGGNTVPRTPNNEEDHVVDFDLLEKLETS